MRFQSARPHLQLINQRARFLSVEDSMLPVLATSSGVRVPWWTIVVQWAEMGLWKLRNRSERVTRESYNDPAPSAASVRGKVK
jgi:hypothetical protein